MAGRVVGVLVQPAGMHKGLLEQTLVADRKAEA